MRKQEFLALLRKGLSGLPRDDMEERLLFYSEMIDDRMEEGLSEEEAISEVGSVDAIVAQTTADIPPARIAKENLKSKKQRNAWEIVLLALGSPIWLSLGIAAFAVIFSLYIALWSVIIAFWAVFASLAACCLGGFLAGIILILGSKRVSGIFLCAAGIICAGLSIFLFFGCHAATKGIGKLSKKIALWVKHFFVKKEAIL